VASNNENRDLKNEKEIVKNMDILLCLYLYYFGFLVSSPRMMERNYLKGKTTILVDDSFAFDRRSSCCISK
jgi:hypothetical protein